MTKIDELMALAWAMRGAQGASALTASASDLKKALEAALKNGGEPSLNYEPVFEFASKHRVSYNELCAVVRSACAAPPVQTPVEKS